MSRELRRERVRVKKRVKEVGNASDATKKEQIRGRQRARYAHAAKY